MALNSSLGPSSTPLYMDPPVTFELMPLVWVTFLRSVELTFGAEFWSTKMTPSTESGGYNCVRGFLSKGSLLTACSQALHEEYFCL